MIIFGYIVENEQFGNKSFKRERSFKDLQWGKMQNLNLSKDDSKIYVLTTRRESCHLLQRRNWGKRKFDIKDQEFDFGHVAFGGKLELEGISI